MKVGKSETVNIPHKIRTNQPNQQMIKPVDNKLFCWHDGHVKKMATVAGMGLTLAQIHTPCYQGKALCCYF